MCTAACVMASTSKGDSRWALFLFFRRSFGEGNYPIFGENLKYWVLYEGESEVSEGSYHINGKNRKI